MTTTNISKNDNLLKTRMVTESLKLFLTIRVSVPSSEKSLSKPKKLLEVYSVSGGKVVLPVSVVYRK